MKFIPNTNKKPIIALVIFLLISSLVFVGFSFFVNALSSVIMKLLGMVLLLLATVFVSRYLTCTYIYVINDTDFVITKCTATNEIVLCRLSFQAISEICEYQKARKKIKDEKLHVTSYSSNIFPKDAYFLFYDMGNEKGVILFEPSASFALELQKRTKTDISL